MAARRNASAREKGLAAANEFDVAVVGGGLVGAATSWGLAREGLRVALLDEGDRAVRASRGNFALVWVQSKGLGLAPYAGWTIRSSNAWGGFADLLKQETGLDVRFQRPGGFHLALSEKELEARVNALRRLHAQPGIVDYIWSYVGEALARVEDAPDSPSRVQALAGLIDQRASVDDVLRGELEALVAEARAGSVDVGSIAQSVIGDQNVQVAGASD